MSFSCTDKENMMNLIKEREWRSVIETRFYVVKNWVKQIPAAERYGAMKKK